MICIPILIFTMAFITVTLEARMTNPSSSHMYISNPDYHLWIKKPLACATWFRFSFNCTPNWNKVLFYLIYLRPKTMMHVEIYIFININMCNFPTCIKTSLGYIHTTINLFYTLPNKLLTRYNTFNTSFDIVYSINSLKHWVVVEVSKKERLEWPNQVL